MDSKDEKKMSKEERDQYLKELIMSSNYTQTIINRADEKMDKFLDQLIAEKETEEQKQ